jgi:hypothetical protein
MAQVGPLGRPLQERFQYRLSQSNYRKSSFYKPRARAKPGGSASLVGKQFCGGRGSMEKKPELGPNEYEVLKIEQLKTFKVVNESHE